MRRARLASTRGLLVWASLLAFLVPSTPGANATEPPVEEVFTLEGGGARAGDPPPSPWARVLRNLRLDVDVVSRVEHSEERGNPAFLNLVGIDLHKTVSGAAGDFATFLLQPYLVRRDDALGVPPHVEDDDDWEFELHDFYVNVTRWGKGRTNLKLGHFDLPFGLEPNTNTHFTLYQLIPIQNLGTKKDWGVSLNGSLAKLDYEIALTRGSGVEYKSKGNGKNFAVAGRVGTPSDGNLVLGVSGLFGRIFDPMRVKRWRMGLTPSPGGGPGKGSRRREELARAGLVERVRVGVDGTWIRGPFTFQSEFSGGRDFGQDVLTGLLEAAWTAPGEEYRAYTQVVYLGQRQFGGWDQDVLLRVGGVWAIDGHWALSMQYARDLETFGPRPKDGKAGLQLRLKF